ncbi:hypothetical protein JNN96_34850 [Mycobacterium sp. DSM 3803]|nr:hypothetical protein [Mycobacterium sp. DSM 3803]
MISTVLDKTLQLFGRAFLVSAFIPTLVAVAVLNIVWHGYGQVAATAKRWATDGIGAAAVDIVSWFLAIYLAAYVVYGIRSVLRTLFQGIWPAPLKWVQNLGERLAIRRFRRTRDRLKSLTDRKNDVAWIVDDTNWCVRAPCDWNTTPPWTAPGTPPHPVNPILKRARRRLKTAHRVVDLRWVPAWWRQRSILRALASGRAALTWVGSSSPEQQRAINNIRTSLQELCVSDTSCEDHRMRDERFIVAVQGGAAWIERLRGRAEVKRNADYPPNEEQVRATVFGNVMARLIAYPATRYQIPLDTLWPRLTHLVPEPELRRVDDASVFVDFSVVSGAAAAVVVIGSATAGFLVDGSVLRAVGFGIGGAMAAVVFNRVAITAARSFAEEVQACIDLDRLALLEKLGYQRPKDLAAERAMWNALYSFLSRGRLPKDMRVLEQSSGPEETPKQAVGRSGRSPNPIPGSLSRLAARTTPK